MKVIEGVVEWRVRRGERCELNNSLLKTCLKTTWNGLMKCWDRDR